MIQSPPDTQVGGAWGKLKNGDGSTAGQGHADQPLRMWEREQQVPALSDEGCV